LLAIKTWLHLVTLLHSFVAGVIDYAARLLGQTSSNISSLVLVGLSPKKGRQINVIASRELKPTHRPSLAPKATLRIDGHAYYCHKSLVTPGIVRLVARRMAELKRLHHGRVAVPHFLGINTPRLAFPTSSNLQIMAGIAASKANRSMDTPACCFTPKFLS